MNPRGGMNQTCPNTSFGNRTCWRAIRSRPEMVQSGSKNPKEITSQTLYCGGQEVKANFTAFKTRTCIPGGDSFFWLRRRYGAMFFSQFACTFLSRWPGKSRCPRRSVSRESRDLVKPCRWFLCYLSFWDVLRGLKKNCISITVEPRVNGPNGPNQRRNLQSGPSHPSQPDGSANFGRLGANRGRTWKTPWAIDFSWPRSQFGKQSAWSWEWREGHCWSPCWFPAVLFTVFPGVSGGFLRRIPGKNGGIPVSQECLLHGRESGLSSGQGSLCPFWSWRRWGSSLRAQRKQRPVSKRKKRKAHEDWSTYGYPVYSEYGEWPGTPSTSYVISPWCDFGGIHFCCSAVTFLNEAQSRANIECGPYDLQGNNAAWYLLGAFTFFLRGGKSREACLLFLAALLVRQPFEGPNSRGWCLVHSFKRTFFPKTDRHFARVLKFWVAFQTDPDPWVQMGKLPLESSICFSPEKKKKKKTSSDTLQ